MGFPILASVLSLSLESSAGFTAGGVSGVDKLRPGRPEGVSTGLSSVETEVRRPLAIFSSPAALPVETVFLCVLTDLEVLLPVGVRSWSSLPPTEGGVGGPPPASDAVVRVDPEAPGGLISTLIARVCNSCIRCMVPFGIVLALPAEEPDIVCESGGRLLTGWAVPYCDIEVEVVDW